ncbi:unnamed protein product [Lactuca saligna]|uniref:Uncharacterized protein n=1 Tax=Lactuca saligna TaxID=75948 RepID=A0AA35VHS3_LACSI|nr:unnamed protein product [Lactuca saligna]
MSRSLTMNRRNNRMTTFRSTNRVYSSHVVSIISSIPSTNDLQLRTTFTVADLFLTFEKSVVVDLQLFRKSSLFGTYQCDLMLYKGLYHEFQSLLPKFSNNCKRKFWHKKGLYRCQQKRFDLKRAAPRDISSQYKSLQRVMAEDSLVMVVLPQNGMNLSMNIANHEPKLDTTNHVYKIWMKL